MDPLKHIGMILDLTFEALEKAPQEFDHDDLKSQLLKTKTEMAFTEDDPHLQKEVAVIHGKEMP